MGRRLLDTVIRKNIREPLVRYQLPGKRLQRGKIIRGPGQVGEGGETAVIIKMSFFRRVQKKARQIIIILYNGMQYGYDIASYGRRYLFIITGLQKAAERFIASGGAACDFKSDSVGKINDFLCKRIRNASKRIIIILEILGFFLALRHAPGNQGAEQGEYA